MILILRLLTSFFMQGHWKELERKDLPLRPPLGTGYGRCKQLFTLFFRFIYETDPKHSTIDPEGNPDAHSFHHTSPTSPPSSP